MKKIPKIKQRDITDCAAACLAAIASYYNLKMPVSIIRQYAGTDKLGTNIIGLIEAAQSLGFEAKGVKGLKESLKEIPLPAIAHLVLPNGIKHFVVIFKCSNAKIWMMDPADGEIHKKHLDIFMKEWSGVLVLLLPADGFVKGDNRISVHKRFWQLIQPHRSTMLYALAAAGFFTFLGLASAIYLQKLVDFVLPNSNLQLLQLLSVGMLLILLLQLCMGIFKALLGLQTGQQIDASLILGYYKHLLKLPQQFFDSMRVGEIVSRVNDAVKIRLFVNEIALNLILNLLIVAFSIGIMFLYYWKLALIMISIVPVYVAIYSCSNYINKQWQRRLMENSADLESQLVESLNAVGSIKKLGLEQYANLKTENRFIVLLRNLYSSGIKGIYLGAGVDICSKLYTIIILWTGSYFVINHELSTGELLSFYSLIGYFTGPAASLIGANKNIQDAMIAADRLFEIIDLETETQAKRSIRMNPEKVGDIVFNQVHFRYGTRITVFENLNFAIKKGETVAFVGESGSGKSTLSALLLHLYPIKNGNITIGGIDIRFIETPCLRNLIAVVPQQIDLFAGTIIENIAIGDEDPNFNKILEIARLLGIDEFIEKLPSNYHTILQEQGSNLSGGQRQRLGIARALYRSPEILIMDEATSHLDYASEARVQEMLAVLKRLGKTIIIITHRMNSIKACDRIFVIKNGNIAEAGTHEELMDAGNHYSALLNSYRQ